VDEEVQVTPEEVEAETPSDEAEEVEETPEAEALDERGVPWKNVAKEEQRKRSEAEREAELMKKLLAQTPAKVEEAKEPETTATFDELWKSGRIAEAMVQIVEKVSDERDRRKTLSAAAEAATGTREKLLIDYPDLADHSSELYKAAAKAGGELKREWEGMGLNVDVKTLEREGTISILERQAVERAIVGNPALAPNQEGIVKKRTESTPSTGGVVTQPTGKPPVSKKPAAAAEAKISPEELALMKQYGLRTDEASVKDYLEKKKTAGLFSDRQRREEA